MASISAKLLETISSADVVALVENKEHEGKEIEYKERLPSKSEGDLDEFSGDVASFANCIGGDIIYGIREERESGPPTGIPGAIMGVGSINFDQEKLRLEQILRARIEPRISGIGFRMVGEDNCVLIVRIPRSWNSPHMVKNTGRFYSRSTAGKYPLDVGEIKSAFLRATTTGEKIRSFRAERAARLSAGEGPIGHTGYGLVVLHIVPVGVFGELGDTEDFAAPFYTSPSNLVQKLAPLGWRRFGGSSSQINFDGFMTYAEKRNTQMNSQIKNCTQIFRNGIIEAVDSWLLSPHAPAGERLISGGALKEEIIEGVGSYLGLLKNLNVTPPIVIMLSGLYT